MDATTIKLDPRLHAAIRRLKSRDQTLTAYVRDLVAREEKRAALHAAADAYSALLGRRKDEAQWLSDWESARLDQSPKRRARK